MFSAQFIKERHKAYKRSSFVSVMLLLIFFLPIAMGYLPIEKYLKTDNWSITMEYVFIAPFFVFSIACLFILLRGIKKRVERYSLLCPFCDKLFISVENGQCPNCKALITEDGLTLKIIEDVYLKLSDNFIIALISGLVVVAPIFGVFGIVFDFLKNFLQQYLSLNYKIFLIFIMPSVFLILIWFILKIWWKFLARIGFLSSEEYKTISYWMNRK